MLLHYYRIGMTMSKTCHVCKCGKHNKTVAVEGKASGGPVWVYGEGGAVIRKKAGTTSEEKSIVKSRGSCDVETCFATGGRCLYKPVVRPVCKPYDANTGKQWLRRWEDEHVQGRCTGCVCTPYPRNPQVKVREGKEKKRTG